MYQVVKIFGDNEPWWFFEEWQADIQQVTVFDDFTEASRHFESQWHDLAKCYPRRNGKPNYLSAFWSEADERWCEECDDFLQQYMGLALLKDYQPITEHCETIIQESTTSFGKIKSCKFLKQSFAS
ncbi:MAG: DUF1033 family protein [Enterococcus sp.]